MSETIDEAKVQELAGKVVGDVAGAMSLFMAYLGDQAGVFAAMDGAGPVTVEALAAKTGLNEKYLHEWLGSVAAAGTRVSDVPVVVHGGVGTGAQGIRDLLQLAAVSDAVGCPLSGRAGVVVDEREVGCQIRWVAQPFAVADEDVELR